MRASPGSMPSRTPGTLNGRSEWLISTGSDRSTNGLQGLVDPGGVGAAALRDVVLAAALAAEQHRCGPAQVVGGVPSRTTGVVHRGDHGGFAVLDPDQEDC